MITGAASEEPRHTPRRPEGSPRQPTGGKQSTVARIAAAGDIACQADWQVTDSDCAQHATSQLLLAGDYDAILPLGDLQYEDATLADFEASYDKTWGRLKDISHPVPGNHEYKTDGASGYYDYFGASAGERGKGYYSYDLGRWHLIALNSNCSAVGCEAGSEQERWLREDLARNQRSCVLAYWHHPRFSSGMHGSFAEFEPFWQALFEAGADLVLSGHDHTYERFAPQTPTGEPDAVSGIREFVVGTGGRGFYEFRTTERNSEVRSNDTHGVIELTLHPRSYDWKFVPEQGGSFTDSGSARCH
jgi:hypothetical protein